jgi:trimeric autotransporter adhesin
MAGNSININSDVNTVNIQPDNNKITVVNPDNTSVNITQPVTNVIQVATPGPAGPAGPTGPTGPSGSFETGSFVTTSSFNSFTSSIQTEVDNLTAQTGSYVLNSQTGSFTTTSSFNSFTSSIQSEVDSLTSATSSYVSNSQTGSFTTTSSFNSFTSSIQSEVNSLTSVTGSFTTTSSFNSFTSSIQSEVDSLTLQTGSYATTGSNNFVGNQTISGSLTVSGSSTFTNIGPAVFTGTSTFTNITASGNISASATITANTLTASGLIYPSTDGTDGQAIITDGAGNLSFATSTTEKLHLQVRNDDDVDIPAGTPIYSTGEIGGSERINVKIASGSDASKMPAIGIAETTLTTTGGTKDGFAIINGIYNTNVTPVSGTPVLGSNVYVHASGGLTTIKPSGSTLIQNIGIILKTNGTVIQGMKVSSIDRTNDVPNLLENQIFFGSGSNQSQQIHISGALDQTIINNITASGNISSSGIVYGTTGSFSYLQGNSPITVGDSVTFQQPITASGNINVNGTITATSASFTHISGTISNIIWTVDFTDGELNTTLYAPYNLAINSVTNVYNSPTSSISSSGSPYTLGNAITTGEPIDITVSTGSVINLNITR